MDFNEKNISADRVGTDATPSWNGYNHQGKVALYVVLSWFNTNNFDLDSCKHYALELDWIEDFSIKHNDLYTEIHQVKTYDASAFSKYQDAVWLLLGKSVLLPGVERSYLHTTKAISCPVSEMKSTFKGYKPPSPPEPSKDKDKDESKKETLLSPWDYYNYITVNDKYDEAFSKFSVYEYGNDLFCRLEDIEKKIKGQLNLFYNESRTSDHIDRAYLHLLGLIDSHIRDRHKAIQKGESKRKATIEFSNIFELLQQDFELSSREYYIYQLRDQFNKITTQYLEDLFFDEENEIDNKPDISNLTRLVRYVSLLEDNDFLNFCKKVTPHYPVNDNDPKTMLDAFRNLINEYGMKRGFLKILKEIRREINTNKYTFSKKDSEGRNISYLPTTIIDENTKSAKRSVVHGIVRNWSLVDDSLHEIDVMISSDMNMPDLLADKFTSNIPEPEVEMDINNYLSKSTVEREEFYKRITKVKKTRLIDLRNAKGELDDETNS